MPDLSTNPPAPKQPLFVSSESTCWRPRGINGRTLVQLNCTIHALRPLHFQEAFRIKFVPLKELLLGASSCNSLGGLAERVSLSD
jgi:hypothetical protein